MPSSPSTGKVRAPTRITHRDELSDELSDNVRRPFARDVENTDGPLAHSCPSYLQSAEPTSVSQLSPLISLQTTSARQSHCSATLFFFFFQMSPARLPLSALIVLSVV